MDPTPTPTVTPPAAPAQHIWVRDVPPDLLDALDRHIATALQGTVGARRPSRSAATIAILRAYLAGDRPAPRDLAPAPPPALGASAPTPAPPACPAPLTDRFPEADWPVSTDPACALPQAPLGVAEPFVPTHADGVVRTHVRLRVGFYDAEATGAWHAQNHYSSLFRAPETDGHRALCQGLAGPVRPEDFVTPRRALTVHGLRLVPEGPPYEVPWTPPAGGESWKTAWRAAEATDPTYPELAGVVRDLLAVNPLEWSLDGAYTTRCPPLLPDAHVPGALRADFAQPVLLDVALPGPIGVTGTFCVNSPRSWAGIVRTSHGPDVALVQTFRLELLTPDAPPAVPAVPYKALGSGLALRSAPSSILHLDLARDAAGAYRPPAEPHEALHGLWSRDCAWDGSFRDQAVGARALVVAACGGPQRCGGDDVQNARASGLFFAEGAARTALEDFLRTHALVLWHRWQGDPDDHPARTAWTLWTADPTFTLPPDRDLVRLALPPGTVFPPSGYEYERLDVEVTRVHATPWRVPASIPATESVIVQSLRFTVHGPRLACPT